MQWLCEQSSVVNLVFQKVPRTCYWTPGPREMTCTLEFLSLSFSPSITPWHIRRAVRATHLVHAWTGVTAHREIQNEETKTLMASLLSRFDSLSSLGVELRPRHASLGDVEYDELLASLSCQRLFPPARTWKSLCSSKGPCTCWLSFAEYLLFAGI